MDSNNVIWQGQFFYYIMIFLLLATAPVFLTCAAFQDLRIEAFNKRLSREGLFKTLNFAPNLL